MPAVEKLRNFFSLVQLSGFGMMLRVGRYIVRAYVRSNRQQERRLYIYYQKKYFSGMTPTLKHQKYIRQKLNEFIMWYDEFTGMDEVRLAQRRVLEDEELFRKAQEDRRSVLNELTDIQQKLKDLYAELENTFRGDDRYVVLVTQEHKLLKEEKLVLEKFSRAEKLERDAFAALSSSVKLSHEKERAQSERTKYWSIIGSILGTVLGILGSSINNHFKMNELKQLIKNSTNLQLIDSLNSYLEVNEKAIAEFRSNSKITEESNIVKVEEILNSLSNRMTNLEVCVNNIEKNMTKLEPDAESSVIVTVPTGRLEESLRKDYSQVKMLLFTVAVLSVLMPIVSRYS